MIATNWIVWALLSAFFAALTAILAKLGLEGVDSNFATAIRTVVILIFAWTIVFFGRPVSWETLGGKTWLFLVLSGVATGLSWLCYFRALKLGDASRVAPLDKLSVVMAMILAVLFLKEKVNGFQWVGGGLMALGAILVTLAK